MGNEEQFDFFISYTKSDEPWAEWIAWQLEEESKPPYRVFLQAWDFLPAYDFIQKMQQGLTQANRVIAVLTPQFLQGEYTTAEWQAAFARDPTGKLGHLVPIRVVKCKPEGLLKARGYIDLVGLDENQASEQLLKKIEGKRLKPDISPMFPPGSRVTKTQVTFPGLIAKLPTPTKLLKTYCQSWRDILTDPLSNQESTIAHLRLNRYVWPRLSWEQNLPSRGSKERKRMSIGGAGIESARNLVAELLKKRFVILHDCAGMGKTAFTYKCLELLLEKHQWAEWFRGAPPLVVRLEGRWPRNVETGTWGSPPPLPLNIRDMLVAQVDRRLRKDSRNLAAKLGSDERSALIAGLVDAALADRRVVIFLDAFDQMSPEDREHVSRLLEPTAVDAGPQDPDTKECVWFVTGRAYALRPFEKRLPPECGRLRLEPLDKSEQDDYFADFAVHDFFTSLNQKPLDWICRPRSKLTEDLGVPLNLREIRTLLESLLEHEVASPTHDMNAWDDKRIATTGELHSLVSRVLLERALKHWEARMPDTSPISSGDPHDGYLRLRLLMHVCGLIALQMMLEERYNASVDADARLPGSVPKVDGVKSFLERARRRFLASAARPEELASADRDSRQDTASERWNWAVRVLEEIEVTHRHHIDSFNPECRSFRDRKTMEWYAAYYLMNHATSQDLHEPIQDAGNRCVRQFAFDNQWLSNCWRQAIEMPRMSVQDEVAVATLGVLFSQPTQDENDSRRPCELMWLAWECWLQPKPGSSDRAAGPLQGAEQLIAEYHAQFRKLREQGTRDEQVLVSSLEFQPQRDAPDLHLRNRTPHGQYRRIPPEGPGIRFRGERPAEVMVSAFWLRKFVVTNAEYRLFDPNHRSSFSDEFNNPAQPVGDVDWYSAVMFCHWLGEGYGLPSEAQWEAACRANDGWIPESEFWFGDRVSRVRDHGWIDENSGGRPHNLSESQQAGGHESPWGLFDMHGNVWEWCSDRYGEYSEDVVNDGQGVSTGSDRVARGGAWSISAETASSTFRNSFSPLYRSYTLGFRVALCPLGEQAERPAR